MKRPGWPADACPVDAGVPACDTGPAGRLAWAIREIAGLLRRRGGDRAR